MIKKFILNNGKMPQTELARATNSEPEDIIIVENLATGFGENLVLEDISFRVRKGEILLILGASGCGKSTLIKALTGLMPVQGRVWIMGREITGENAHEELNEVRKHIGLLFQGGALFESLTLKENVALRLHEFTNLPEEIINIIVQLKLDLVGLGKYGDIMPGELSGGMRKRGGLARSTSLDPKILFCDEPTAGLDPETARQIDALLLETNIYMGITLVVVTHDLDSIANLSGHAIMLSPRRKGVIASGKPEELKDSTDPEVRDFFRRRVGESIPRGSV